MAESATPVHISGEAYQAHKIETFDTACMKMKTEECQFFYLATLSAKQNHAPEFIAECENARIFYPVGDKKEIMAVKKESEMEERNNSSEAAGLKVIVSGSFA